MCSEHPTKSDGEWVNSKDGKIQGNIHFKALKKNQNSTPSKSPTTTSSTLANPLLHSTPQKLSTSRTNKTSLFHLMNCRKQ